MPASQMLICSMGGGPPPPPPTLTDIIDTFTASNGTDPTSRDIDANGGITGFNRWRLNYQPGEIQSNALVGGGAWIADSAQVVNIYLEDSPYTVYPLPLPWMLLIDGLTIASGTYSGGNAPLFYLSSYSDVGGILIYFRRDSSGSSTLHCTYDIGNATTSFNNYSEDGGAGHAIGSLGPHKLGVFFDTDGVSVILNGSVLHTSTGGDAVYSDFAHFEHELDGTLSANTTLNRICPILTTVADLTAAIALTT